MFNKLKPLLIRNYINARGKYTGRKIVIIESDDWGSVRMPSKEVFNHLLRNGIQVNRCHYCSNDSLESEDDLSLLFEILSSVKDRHANPAKITANSIVTNPDFDKIRENNFEKYEYKLITQNYKEIKGCENSFELMLEAGHRGLITFQSHGREHINIKRWLYYLKNNYPETRLAFDAGVYGISTHITSEKRKSFLPAFDFETREEETEVNRIAIDGLRIFEELFGFQSSSFIASNYIWGKSLEEAITGSGVKYIQGERAHRYKVLPGERSKKRLRYFGKKTGIGQIDLVRNATFEPSERPVLDWVDLCLKDIKTAFFWKQPAVICSHRVNFMGGLNVKNRDVNLKLLKRLLAEIVKRWPEVEFMDSAQLGDLISQKRR